MTARIIHLKHIPKFLPVPKCWGDEENTYECKEGSISFSPLYCPMAAEIAAVVSEAYLDIRHPALEYRIMTQVHSLLSIVDCYNQGMIYCIDLNVSLKAINGLSKNLQDNIFSRGMMPCIDLVAGLELISDRMITNKISCYEVFIYTVLGEPGYYIVGSDRHGWG